MESRNLKILALFFFITFPSSSSFLFGVEIGWYSSRPDIDDAHRVISPSSPLGKRLASKLKYSQWPNKYSSMAVRFDQKYLFGDL